MELSTHKIGWDEVELLASIYREEFSEAIPNIDDLYNLFIKKWKDEMVDYLYSNRDAFEIQDHDFENIDEHFGSYGIQVPSFEDVHRWLDITRMTYITGRGEVIHSPLVNVW